MFITINEKARIHVDLPNYTLEYKSVVKEGKRAGEEQWTTRGYYSTPTGALFTAAHDEVCTREQVMEIHEFGKLFQAVCREYRVRLAVLWDEKRFQELLAKGEDPSPKIDVVYAESARGGVKPPFDTEAATSMLKKSEASKKKRTPTRAAR